MKEKSLSIGRIIVIALAATAAVACGGRHGRESNVGASSSSGGNAERRAPRGACNGGTSNATPIGRTGAGATVALARIGGRRVALIADEDAKAILTLDLDTKAELAETRLDGAPAQVYVGKDGVVFATVRDKSELVALTASRADAPLAVACRTSTASEPIAIAATPDDAHVVVTSGWGQRVSVFQAGSLALEQETHVPREPRGVVVSDDGRTAFVSHAVGGTISVVGIGSGKQEPQAVKIRGYHAGVLQEIARRRRALTKAETEAQRQMLGQIEEATKQLEAGRPSCQGFALAKSSAVAGRIFAPHVTVEPGRPETRPDGYGEHRLPTESPGVAVLDEGTKATLDPSLTVENEAFSFSRSIGFGVDARDQAPECLLPRAAAIDPQTKSLLVTCLGIDSVVAYDATAASPLAAERRRWTVGSGPSGVAVDVDKHTAIVWSQFDRSISVFDIGTNDLVDDKRAPRAVKTARLAPLKQRLDTDYALGRIIFHAAGDGRISHDGRACASCHPDGRDDAITWATPEGPRRSILLAGRVTRTAPYSWNGDAKTLPGHLGNTFDRLSGKGLRSVELDALVAYVSAMPAPAGSTLTASDPAKVERGKQIFHSREAGCSGCHSGESYTDGQNHDVGSKAKADRGAAFNTPSLRYVGGTGPYFHDGRYESLAELLLKSDGKMGRTSHLNGADLDALETFLRTL